MQERTSKRRPKAKRIWEYVVFSIPCALAAVDIVPQINRGRLLSRDLPPCFLGSLFVPFVTTSSLTDRHIFRDVPQC